MTVFLAVAVLATPQIEQFDLSPQFKKWGKAKYSFEITGVESGQKLSAEGVLESAIVKSDRSSFVVKSTSLGVIVRLGTQEIRDDRESPSQVIYGLRGQVLGSDNAEVSAMQLARAVRFVSPEAKVKEGDTWTFDYPAVNGVPASRMTSTVKGVAKVDKKVLVTVASLFLESGVDKPMSGTGLWTIDASDGSTVSTNMTLLNWMDGGTKPGTYSTKKL